MDPAPQSSRAENLTQNSSPAASSGLEYPTASLTTEPEQAGGWLTVLETTSPIGIFRTTADGRFVYVNQRWCEITGAPAAAATDFGWQQAIHSDDRERVITEWRQAIQQSLSFQSQCRFQRPDRSEIWVLLQAVADSDPNGILISYIGTATDITQRKQAEELLRQQAQREQMLNRVVQAIRQSLDLPTLFSTAVKEVSHLLRVEYAAIVQYRPEQRIWQHIAAYSPNNALNTSLNLEVADDGNLLAEKLKRFEVVRVNDAATLVDSVNQTIAQTYPGAWLLVPLHFSNTIWGSLSCRRTEVPSPWTDAEVELACAVADQLAIAIQQSQLFQQVQRLNADLEQRVQLHTAQLQLAFDFEATLKRITDRVRDSLDEDQILQTAVQELAIAMNVRSCNAALYNLEQRTSTVRYEYTTSLAPIQGRIVQMDNFAEGYQQLMDGQYFQFCSLLPNPHRGQAMMFACPILDDQGVLGDLWLVSHCDRVFTEQDIRLVQQVTNQCAIALRQARLYQEAQAQVEELEKLNRLKDDFLSTVSHELRTPMSNIKLAGQMLEIILRRSNLLGDDTSALDRYFRILRDECQREINLINDLLDLSRLEVGKKPLVLETIVLQEWLPDCIKPFWERAQTQQQSMALTIDTDLAPITTDLSYLDRIVTELLSNACKYTPANEHIEVVVSAALLTLQIQVSNSGVEISSTEIVRIFDKFYRIPNNDPWKHGGTGLGLALVKKLVETLGGSIDVSSQANLTTFTVLLPMDSGLVR